MAADLCTDIGGQMMETNTLIEVAHELIGKIEPVGETRTDERRYDNLEKAIGLCEQLLKEIEFVARYRDRQEYSIKKSGKKAEKFLFEVCDKYEEYIKR